MPSRWHLVRGAFGIHTVFARSTLDSITTERSEAGSFKLYDVVALARRDGMANKYNKHNNIFRCGVRITRAQ